MTDTQSIVHRLAAITSIETPEELDDLDSTVVELFQSPHPEQGIDVLFHIFERFPNSDGYGIFWTILHGLESLPNYQPSLLASVRRQPTEFNLAMINRMLNGGIGRIGDTDLVRFLEEIATDTVYSESAREQARRYVARHS